MLMVRNLCRLPLLFSVANHKQSLCHFIFYIYFNGLWSLSVYEKAKAAKAFRLQTAMRQCGNAANSLSYCQGMARLPGRNLACRVEGGFMAYIDMAALSSGARRDQA
jgi:hypothetical protein